MLKWSQSIYTPQNICKEYEQLYDDVLLIEKPKLIETPILPSIPIIIEPNKTPQQILEILNKANIKFWLVNKSCLEAVKHHELKSDILQIGVSTQQEKDVLLSLYKNSNLEIILTHKMQTKNIFLYNKNYLIPSPVVSYLENIFGFKWKELTN